MKEFKEFKEYEEFEERILAPDSSPCTPRTPCLL
jgi:hypothetical protein